MEGDTGSRRAVFSEGRDMSLPWGSWRLLAFLRATKKHPESQREGRGHPEGRRRPP